MEGSARLRPLVQRRFLDSETAGGALLMAAAAAALLLANGPLASAYHRLLDQPYGPFLAARIGRLSLHHWINDGLMAVFFLLVGLEIKREFADGRLSSWEQRRLPLIAAAAGMAAPALIYLAVTGGEPGLKAGWAIPAATDIAFALGVLALLGKRAPTLPKLFLTSVAIADDLGAVVIIAFAYTASIDTLALAAAAGILFILHMIGKSGVRALWPFVLGATCLWYAVLLSGVHATVAGVLAAATVPIIRTPGAPDGPDSPLHRLEHRLAPWVAFLVLPLFGLANSGVALSGPAGFPAPLPVAIAAGLFLGKQLGVFGAVRLAVRFGLARPLRGTTWIQVWGIALLCGIGFTMSLFIGALAFPHDPAKVEEGKIGVLLGSLLSAMAGYFVLRFATPGPCQAREEALAEEEIEAAGDLARIEEKD